jgi:malonyl-CoA/methylmalonyl-CoA synthetase
VSTLVPAGIWPATVTATPGATLPEVWAHHWSAQPGSPVLVDGWDPAHVVDGAALGSRTAALATVLADRGVRPGDRVLWCARATIPSIEALLAIVRTGAVLVPLNPSATDAELDHVVSDASPVLALCDRERPDAFEAGPVFLAIEELIRSAIHVGTAIVPQVMQPHDEALIVYTSGTTGKPKGAVHTHASLLAGVTCLQTAWGWKPADRLVLCLPLFHVHGLCAGLFGTLAAGASAVVFDRFEEDAVMGAAATSTLLFGVPTMYHRLAASGRASALGAFRLCVSGSAPLAVELWQQLDSSGVSVLERYGMTETLLTLSNPLDGERRAGAVGMPLPGVEAGLQGVDEFGVGELLVRGPSLCRGYWGREALSPMDWFATGDLASVSSDGYVSIRGRRTELIITGGHNVYPAEVEAVLSRHPGVVEVAVVGVPSPEWGETVVAFVVGDPDPASLLELAEAELASFKCPREVRLIDALPRNALGKVVRTKLRDDRTQPRS